MKRSRPRPLPVQENWNATWKKPMPLVQGFQLVTPLVALGPESW